MKTFNKVSNSILIGQSLVLFALISGCGPAADAPIDAGVDTHRASNDGGSSDVGADGGKGSSTSADTLLAVSLSCTGDAQCGSGFCVDGVCCDSACDGSCRSCVMTGKVGTCSPVIEAQDDTCGGESTCDTDGNCRKELGKACSVGADCGSGSCVDGVCCASDACGTCQSCAVPGSVGICAPVPKFTDDPETCPKDTSTCNGLGACQLKNGQPCATASACTSQSCTDGVCCETACNGTCFSCNQPGSLGQCKPIDGAEDPSADAPCEGASICVAPGDAAPTCKLKDGEDCTTSDQCANGSCLTSYADDDHDGWGGNAVRRCELTPQPGHVLKGGDCCDLQMNAHPGVAAYTQGQDACGSSDWNCDGVVESQTTCTSLGKFGSTCTTSYR